VTLATAPVGNFISGHVQTVPETMLVTFEVRTFNHIGTISIIRPKI